ncbi:MAG: endonuclease V [Gammaproteobacteria bacterium]
MILAVDVDYRGQAAFIAGISFDNWHDESATRIFGSRLNDIEDYVPGQFYRRELPCLLKLVMEHHIAPDIIVIDGLVYLDGHSKPGLGKYLYDALQAKISVLGVAKKPFKGIGKAYELLRGKSDKPLYITSIGLPLVEAKHHIQAMHGKFRIPTLLKRVDRLAKAMR